MMLEFHAQNTRYETVEFDYIPRPLCESCGNTMGCALIQRHVTGHPVLLTASSQNNTHTHTQIRRLLCGNPSVTQVVR